MKILFLDAYFEPEQIAFSHLERDLIDFFVEKGHTVEIVCPTPTRGIDKITNKKYRKIKSEYLYDGNVHVTRFYAPQEHGHPFIRAIRYFWCNLRSYQVGMQMENVDAVFCNSTPPTQGWIAGKVAKNHNVPFVYSLQDVFPDSLVSSGMTNEGSYVWMIGRKIENATYKLCSKIIVISESMKNNLLNKGVKEEDIQVISNWIDINNVKPISKDENILFNEFGISKDKFIVLYAGNFGAAQGAGIILDAAAQLEDESNIQFVIFGGGSEFQSAIQRAKSLSNVFIHPLLPIEFISAVYSMGDIALITCKKGVGSTGLPSKLWSIMACNTPIIASFDTNSDLATIIRESGIGIVTEPENSHQLKMEILNAFKTGSLNNCGQKGRDFVINKASKQKCVEGYLSLIIQ